MGRASYLWTCHYFGARWWRKICELAPAGAPLVEVCEAAARAAVEGEPAERRPTILMAWGAAQLIAEEHDNHEPLRWLQGLGLAPDPHTTPIGDLVDVLDSMRADAARPKETH